MSEDKEYKIGYKKPPRGYGFKKGQIVNPGGKPKLSEELREARKVTKQSFEEKLQEFMRLPMVQLEEMMLMYQDNNTKTLDMLVGSIITRAVMDGCVTRMNFLLDRLGVKSGFNEGDATITVTTANTTGDGASVSDAPFYVVEINQGGKFLRARPRQLLGSELKQNEPASESAASTND